MLAEKQPCHEELWHTGGTRLSRQALEGKKRRENPAVVLTRESNYALKCGSTFSVKSVVNISIRIIALFPSAISAN
jgi:hypothetical protein